MNLFYTALLTLLVAADVVVASDIKVLPSVPVKSIPRSTASQPITPVLAQTVPAPALNWGRTPASLSAPNRNYQIPPNATAVEPLAGVGDVSIILTSNQFFPSRIRLRDGQRIRLLFTTTNPKPAALVIERLQIQKWIAGTSDEPKRQVANFQLEINRELSPQRIAEVVLEPKLGVYEFHDAISGAAGEIVVE